MNTEHSHIPKQSGFKLPENYFDNLNSELYTVSKLKNEHTSSGFTLPENYLNDFQNVIEEKIICKPKTISLFNKKNSLYVLSLAASIIVLLGLVLNTNPASIANLESDIVENYIIDEIDALDLTDLFENDIPSEAQFINYNITEEALNNYIDSFDTDELLEKN